MIWLVVSVYAHVGCGGMAGASWIRRRRNTHLLLPIMPADNQLRFPKAPCLANTTFLYINHRSAPSCLSGAWARPPSCR